MDTHKCFRDLFIIAEEKPITASKIYESLPKGFYSISDIRPYFKRDNQNTKVLAAQIAIESLEKGLTLDDYLIIFDIEDPVIQLRAKDAFMRISKDEAGIGKLCRRLNNKSYSYAHDAIRALLLKRYKDKLSWEMLIGFQGSSDEIIRTISKEILLSRANVKWRKLSLLKLAANADKHISDIARLILLKNFEKLLEMKNLIDFQKSEDENIRNLSKLKLLSLPVSRLNYTILLSNTTNKCVNIKNISTILIIKNFGNYMSGKEIIDTQRSISDEIRALGRDLALKQSKDKYNMKSLEIAQRSGNKHVRSLSSVLIANLNPTRYLTDDVASFIFRHGFYTE